jgi:mono/diheme cytochrome c family protein
MSRGRIIAFLVLLATVLFALAPLVRGRVEIPTAQHHLLHAVMLAGAALSGILFADVTKSAREQRSSAAWLVVAMVTPVLAMLLMWPSEYAYLETHPYGHAVEHGGLILFGFVTGYGGQRYANGIGWAAGISIVAMAFLAVWGYGVAPATANLAASRVASNALTAANVVHGKVIFAQNCAVCHGVAGAGGEGPPLKNERTRKSLAQTQQWIENPAPPMPKLYPSVLSSQNVADVAAYLQSLH